MGQRVIDLRKTKLIVTAYPKHMWPVEIIHWVKILNLPLENLQSISVKNIVCARNEVIKTALASPFEHFIFIDNDVRPTAETEAFLHLEADVKCCEVEHRGVASWSKATSFHQSLWSTSRKVLEAIEPPWVQWRYNDDCTEMVGCLCESFRLKVLEAGFSIAHGGHAKHDSNESWC